LLRRQKEGLWEWEPGAGASWEKEAPLRLALRLRIDARVAAQSPLSRLYFHLESAETSGSGSACVP
jgi:hypothetical protein